MKRYATLFAAAALVLIADAFALMHAARNRSGPIDADITLTEKELAWFPSSDNSGVLLSLQTYQDFNATPAIGRDGLARLGFDVSMDPAAPKAYEFYNRQGQRLIWAVLELREATPIDAQGKPVEHASRLTPVDGGPDPASLRNRYPDRAGYLILPARVRAEIRPEYRQPVHRPAQVYGYVWGFPSGVHVPKPWSDVFSAQRNRGLSAYRVRLQTGGLFEPMVAGVEFAPAPPTR